MCSSWFPADVAISAGWRHVLKAGATRHGTQLWALFGFPRTPGGHSVEHLMGLCKGRRNQQANPLSVRAECLCRPRFERMGGLLSGPVLLWVADDATSSQELTTTHIVETRPTSKAVFTHCLCFRPSVSDDLVGAPSRGINGLTTFPEKRFCDCQKDPTRLHVFGHFSW